MALTLQAFRVRWGAKHSPLTFLQSLSPWWSDIHDLIPSILKVIWVHSFSNRSLIFKGKCIFFLRRFQYAASSDCSPECLKIPNLTPRFRTCVSHFLSASEKGVRSTLVHFSTIYCSHANLSYRRLSDWNNWSWCQSWWCSHSSFSQDTQRTHFLCTTHPF